MSKASLETWDQLIDQTIRRVSRELHSRTLIMEFDNSVAKFSCYDPHECPELAETDQDQTYFRKLQNYHELIGQSVFGVVVPLFHAGLAYKQVQLVLENRKTYVLLSNLDQRVVWFAGDHDVWHRLGKSN